MKYMPFGVHVVFIDAIALSRRVRSRPKNWSREYYRRRTVLRTPSSVKTSGDNIEG